MIAGIPALTFWGIILIGIGTIMTYAGTKSGLKKIIKEQHAETQTKVAEEAENTRAIVVEEADSTKTIITGVKEEVTNQADTTRTALEATQKAIAKTIQNSNNTNLDLLKGHMLKTLKPSIDKSVDIWINYNSNILSYERSKPSNTKMALSCIESYNKLSDAARNMRAQIDATYSFLGDVANSDIQQLQTLTSYLNRLREPNNNHQQKVLKKEITPLQRDQENFKLLYDLKNEFKVVYAGILKL